VESREDVRLLYLSGSTPRGEECASSDLDVAVAVEPLPRPRDLERLTTELEAAARGVWPASCRGQCRGGGAM